MGVVAIVQNIWSSIMEMIKWTYTRTLALCNRSLDHFHYLRPNIL